MPPPRFMDDANTGRPSPRQRMGDDESQRETAVRREGFCSTALFLWAEEAQIEGLSAKATDDGSLSKDTGPSTGFAGG